MAEKKKKARGGTYKEYAEFQKSTRPLTISDMVLVKPKVMEAGVGGARKAAIRRLEQMLNKLLESKGRVKAAKSRKPIVSQAELDSMIARAQVQAKVPGLAKHKAATPGPTKVGNVSTDPNMLKRMKTDKGMAGVTGKRHSLSKKQVDEGTSAARKADLIPPHVQTDRLRKARKKKD
jgi:hypothetical protein